jgi:hypothetical protein
LTTREYAQTGTIGPEFPFVKFRDTALKTIAIEIVAVGLSI